VDTDAVLLIVPLHRIYLHNAKLTIIAVPSR